MPGEIAKHPIDTLITGAITEFAGLFKQPAENPQKERSRHDVLVQYYQNKDVDSNDLDTAYNPDRAMQWADSYNDRHRNDRHPVKIHPNVA